MVVGGWWRVCALPLGDRRWLPAPAAPTRAKRASPPPQLPPRSPAAAGGDEDSYLLSWRGIDAGAYYQQDPDSYVKMLNYRWGCVGVWVWVCSCWSCSAGRGGSVGDGGPELASGPVSHMQPIPLPPP